MRFGRRWESQREPRRKSSDYSRELLENLRGGVELLDQVGPRSPQPPESLSESPKPQFPTISFPSPPHAPDLGVGGFKGLRLLPPTPRKKIKVALEWGFE